MRTSLQQRYMLLFEFPYTSYTQKHVQQQLIPYLDIVSLILSIKIVIYGATAVISMD
jgi:hypothetical protein